MKIELYTISSIAEIHITSNSTKIEETVSNIHGEIDINFINDLVKQCTDFMYPPPPKYVDFYVGLVATQVKKTGAFKLGGALNLKLKKKPATAARKGVNPFAKEPCVFKAKPASKTVKAYAMKKLKDKIN